MSLKLAVSGKGGVGKSTLAGALARLYASDGNKVLAIDADPDANLASAIGLPENLGPQIHTISEERQLIEERTGARVREFGQIFSLNPDVSGIAENYGVSYEGVNLLVLGAIQSAGGGCACPEGVLLKSLIRDLVLNRDEVVILDMEAGIEHLGRGSAMGVDLMLVVVEPGKRSLETASRIKTMTRQLGIKRFGIVLNKVTDEDAQVSDVISEFGADSVYGVIPYDSRIIDADRTGKSLVDIESDDLTNYYRNIQKRIDNEALLKN